MGGRAADLWIHTSRRVCHHSLSKLSELPPLQPSASRIRVSLSLSLHRLLPAPKVPLLYSLPELESTQNCRGLPRPASTREPPNQPVGRVNLWVLVGTAVAGQKTDLLTNLESVSWTRAEDLQLPQPPPKQKGVRRKGRAEGGRRCCWFVQRGIRSCTPGPRPGSRELFRLPDELKILRPWRTPEGQGWHFSFPTSCQC